MAFKVRIAARFQWKIIFFSIYLKNLTSIYFFAFTFPNYSIVLWCPFCSFQPIENKRDQFRKYLEATGVIEVLSKSITKLMESPEKPESPVDFIRDNIGLSQKDLNQLEFLKEEVEVYKKQVNDLKIEIAGLKLERKEVENGLPKEVVVPEPTIADGTLSENDKQSDVESKKTEDVEPTLTKTIDDVQTVDISSDVKAEVAAVTDVVTEIKIEPKPEEIKIDDKAITADASESADK